jgi:hypothetical protein
MIFAHIVGLSQNHKHILYEKYNNSKYIFKDLDDLTDLIMEDKNMSSLIHRYEYYIDKSKNQNITKLQSKQFLAKSREINTKINTYWKSRIDFYINEIINEDCKESKFVILLGYCNFFRNIRIFNVIKTSIKIFITIDMEIYTREIIKINLDEYRNDIIDGNFSLDLINPTYLSKRRDTVHGIYMKHAYEDNTIDECITFLGNSLENYDIPSILFYASKYKYTNRIPLKNIVAYTDEWTAIISSFNDKKIIKGYENDDYSKPFIQELSKGRFKTFNKPIYIYIITNTSLFIPVFTKNYIYKYKLNQSAQISRTIEIPNALKKLKELNISFVTMV